MNNLIKKYTKSNGNYLEEPFSTTWNSSNYNQYTWYGDDYTDKFNYRNWNWYAWWSSNFATIIPQIDGNVLKAGSGQGGNPCFVNMNRNIEGYNLHRNFKLSYSFYLTDDGAHPYPAPCVTSVSLGGNIGLTGYGATLGLEFQTYKMRADTGGGALFLVNSNGTNLGTPYGAIFARAQPYYVFASKTGNSISLSINTSNIEPTSYDYTYTITDFTMQSQSLMLMMYHSGFQDYWMGSQIDNLKILLT